MPLYSINWDADDTALGCIEANCAIVDGRVYIYYLTEVESCTPRYVGTTWRPVTRFKSHCNAQTANRPFRDWIQSVLDRGTRIKMVIIAQVDFEERCSIEQSYIRQYLDAGYPLLNSVKRKWNSPGQSRKYKPSAKSVEPKLYGFSGGKIIDDERVIIPIDET